MHLEAIGLNEQLLSGVLTPQSSELTNYIYIYTYQDQARALCTHWLAELYYGDILRQIYYDRYITADIVG